MEHNEVQETAIDIINQEAGVKAVRDHGGAIRVMNDSDYDDINEAEFIRQTGEAIIEKTGHAITGVRVKDVGTILIWLDEVEGIGSSNHMTIAQKAALILDNKENGTEFEANISDEPKEQYVDVYPEPHEAATEDYGLKEGELTQLRQHGLRVRCMSCGRTRGTYNDENYRIWFEVDE